MASNVVAVLNDEDSLHLSDAISQEVEREFAEKTGFDRPERSIGNFGSFCLICNNIMGPGMMGIPFLFRSAGILPTLTFMLFIYLTSTLTGTLLADAVASIPGNGKFHRNLDFSKAFRIAVGRRWAFLVEIIFIFSCLCNATVALVEAAQSLDGFLVSFLWGETYALQLLPYPSIITWPSPYCDLPSGTDKPFVGGPTSPSTSNNMLLSSSSSASSSCTGVPFNGTGDLVLTLGYVLATMFFLPFGTGHLKDAMAMQVLVFISCLVLMSVFYTEFFKHGLSVNVPMIGDYVWDVPGVMLYNFAYSLAVPNWLIEKRPRVSVNRIIWSASSFITTMYISFGLLAAMTFPTISSNVLVSLSSSQVRVSTRVCAAIFGVAIIGCGIPISSILVKSSLYTSGSCNVWWAFFIGSVFPYMISWTMYQGTLLQGLSDWVGLVGYGLISFVLPLVLALRMIDRSARDRKRRAKLKELEHLGLVDLSEEAVQKVVREAGATGAVSYTDAPAVSVVEENLPLLNTAAAATTGYPRLATAVGRGGRERGGKGGGGGGRGGEQSPSLSSLSSIVSPYNHTATAAGITTSSSPTSPLLKQPYSALYMATTPPASTSNGGNTLSPLRQQHLSKNQQEQGRGGGRFAGGANGAAQSPSILDYGYGNNYGSVTPLDEITRFGTSPSPGLCPGLRPGQGGHSFSSLTPGAETQFLTSPLPLSPPPMGSYNEEATALHLSPTVSTPAGTRQTHHRPRSVRPSSSSSSPAADALQTIDQAKNTVVAAANSALISFLLFPKSAYETVFGAEYSRGDSTTYHSAVTSSQELTNTATAPRNRHRRHPQTPSTAGTVGTTTKSGRKYNHSYRRATKRTGGSNEDSHPHRGRYNSYHRPPMKVYRAVVSELSVAEIDDPSKPPIPLSVYRYQEDNDDEEEHDQGQEKYDSCQSEDGFYLSDNSAGSGTSSNKQQQQRQQYAPLTKGNLAALETTTTPSVGSQESLLTPSQSQVSSTKSQQQQQLQRSGKRSGKIVKIGHGPTAISEKTTTSSNNSNKSESSSLVGIGEYSSFRAAGAASSPHHQQQQQSSSSINISSSSYNGLFKDLFGSSGDGSYGGRSSSGKGPDHPHNSRKKTTASSLFAAAGGGRVTAGFSPAGFSPLKTVIEDDTPIVQTKLKKSDSGDVYLYTRPTFPDRLGVDTVGAASHGSRSHTGDAAVADSSGKTKEDQKYHKGNDKDRIKFPNHPRPPIPPYPELNPIHELPKTMKNRYPADNRTLYDEFDDYSEEDEAEDLYGVEEEDRDAEVFEELDSKLLEMNILQGKGGSTRTDISTTNVTSAATAAGRGGRGGGASATMPVPGVFDIECGSVPDVVKLPALPSKSLRGATPITLSTSVLNNLRNSRLLKRASSESGTMVDPSQLFPDQPTSQSQRERKDALQRYAVFAHKKIPFNYNVIQPLPKWLEPHRKQIVALMVAAFSTIILSTILERVYHAFSV